MRGLQDPEAIVRGQAAFALGQLAEYCQPDINEHYKELLPGVFHVMHDPTPQVQQQACYALDAFCENLGELSSRISRSSKQKLCPAELLQKPGWAKVQKPALQSCIEREISRPIWVSRVS